MIGAAVTYHKEAVLDLIPSQHLGGVLPCLCGFLHHGSRKMKLDCIIQEEVTDPPRMSWTGRSKSGE